MASSSSLFQKSKPPLNQYQQKVLSHFSGKGLAVSDFFGRDWFNNLYHYEAFSFLVNKKKCSYKEAFSILETLNQDQVYGVLQGLSREEVVGLTKRQIDAFLKYGLPKDELVGLGEYQIQALIALRYDDIKSDDLRSQNWINSYDHVVALLYLIRVQAIRENIKNEQSFDYACNYLKDLNANEARAISYGIKKSEVKGLEKDSISELIISRERDGLQSREEVKGLDEYQKVLVKRLYHFGLTSQMIRDHIKQPDRVFTDSLCRLVFERGIPIKSILKLISGLCNHQIYGLSQGLSLDDVSVLNEYQIKALATCRTIKNGLTAEDLRGKSWWFDSDKHVSALKDMLSSGKFTVKEAMQELDGLTGDQAQKVSDHGAKRDDFFGLTEFQLKALDKLRSKGLTGNDLRGKDWFNSDIHVTVLQHLVERDMTIKNALDQLDGLNAEKVNLFITENTKRDIIIKLTPIQLAIIRDKFDYGFYTSSNEFLESTWLKTTEQAELLKAVSNELDNFSKALAIVKHIEIGQVKETLKKIQNGEGIRKFDIAQHLSKDQSSSQNYSRSGGYKRGCN